MSIDFKNIKLSDTNKLMTSYSGLIPILRAMEHSLFFEKLKNILPHCKHGYSPIFKIKSLISMLFCGGSSLSDISRLNCDEGLKKVLGIDSFPKSNTLSNFLNGKITNYVNQLEMFNLDEVIGYYKRMNIYEVTLDIDSTLIENQKYQSKYMYMKFKGYNPMFIVDEENKKVLWGRMRNGNASPQADILSMLKVTIEKLKKAGIQSRVRIDSAGYQKKVIDFLTCENIDFTISGDNFSEKIELFKAIDEKNWIRYNEQIEIAAAYSSISSGGNRSPIKIINKRKQKRDLDLFEGKYSYSYIVTNIERLKCEEIIDFHHMRANAENIFKELKGDFSLDKLPCDEMEANAVMMQIIISAYNIFQMFKERLIEKKWHKHSLKVIRYRIISLAGLVIRHAREWRLLVHRKYVYYEELYKMVEMSKYVCF